MSTLSALVLALAAASTAAFSRAPMRMATEFSQSVPFLKKQPKLDGSMAGDVGFDPLGISNTFDINFLRESEIKHGRVAMLACLGVFVQLAVHLPGSMHTESNPVDAFYAVGPQPFIQIVLFCGVLEWVLHKGNISYTDMDTSDPGNFGFDPLNFGKDPSKLEKYKLNEVKNGRLAMCAIGGLLHSCFVAGSPIAFSQ